MEKKDRSKVNGHLRIQRRDAGSDDDWETIVDKDNMVVDDGLNKLREISQGDSSDRISYFCLGTSDTSVSADDSDLVSQVHQESFDSYTDTATGESRYTGVLDSIEPTPDPYDMKEFGVKFSDETLLARTTFAAETKDSSQEWRIQYTFTFMR